MAAESAVIAELKAASKQYQTPAGTFTALESTTLEVRKAELLLIIGPSGSGKTTLLSLIGCLINPTTGQLLLDGQDVSKLSRLETSKLRLDLIGFVFQQFNLLAPLSARDNVAFPLEMQGLASTLVNTKTEAAMLKVSMTEHGRKLPKQLSGGQQQRIAIARALVTEPRLILCDEPTASLDKESVVLVMEELRNLAKAGKAVVVVTHDPRLTEYADRVVEVKNGNAVPVALESLLK